MIKEITQYVLGFYILIVAFSYSASVILQYALGIHGESMLKIFSTLIFGSALIWGIKEFRRLKNGYNYLFLFMIFVLFYSLTPLFYTNESEAHNSYFLSMLVRMGPAIIVGILTSQNNHYLECIRKAMFPFMLLYTIVVFSVERVASTADVIGFRYAGFNYQILSYYAAYAYCISLYLLNSMCFHGIIGQFKKYLFLVMIVLQLCLTIIPGGRGAFILVIITTLYFTSKKNPLSIFFVGFIFFVICFSMFDMESDNDLFQQGIDRLFGFFGDSNSIENDDRTKLYKRAISLWLDSPLLGNGIGSTWYTLGFYSHNMFCDLLSEGGIILLSIYVYILINFYKKIKRLIALDSKYELIMVIFLNSFVLIMFSGYYSSDSGTWFTFTYVFMSYKKN